MIACAPRHLLADLFSPSATLPSQLTHIEKLRTPHTPLTSHFDQHESARNNMGDRTVISREGWPPSSSTGDRRHLHVRFPGAPEHLPQSISSLDFSSEAIDTGLHSKPRVQRKRDRAEDLWDRDEEELLQQRASRFGSSVLAEAGEKTIQQESSLPQNLDNFGAAGADLLRDGPIEGRGQIYDPPEADALNHAADNTPSCSPESQSRQQAHTQPEGDAVNYAEDTAASRSPESQSHPDLKRLRDRFQDGFATTDDAASEPQKRRRISAGRTEPSTVNGDLPPEKSSQDALANVLLKRLVEEHGKTRAVKAELERYKELHGAIEKSEEIPKRRKRAGVARARRREVKRLAQMDRTTLSAERPSVRREPDGTGRLATFTKFGSLPDNVQDTILDMLLESPDPIRLNSSRLRTFVKNRVGVSDPAWTPTTSRRHKEITLKSPHELRFELDKMKADLNKIPPDQWPSQSVVRGLTLSILLVSKAVHRKAATCFYGNNVFEFSDARHAWLHLEMFLNTIGPDHATNLQHLSVAMPKWFPDTSNDRISGALLDAMSPIMRLAPSNNVTDDPLCSAMSSCTSILAAHGGLKSFQINILLHRLQSFLNPRYQDAPYDRYADEQNNTAIRRNGIFQLLCALDHVLGPECRTELVVHDFLRNQENRCKFQVQLPLIQFEARKYGWDVHPTLKVSRR